MDVSELYRPETEMAAGKDHKEFRDFERDDNPMIDMIRKLYKNLHGRQTVEFVKSCVSIVFISLWILSKWP